MVSQTDTIFKFIELPSCLKDFILFLKNETLKQEGFFWETPEAIKTVLSFALTLNKFTFKLFLRGFKDLRAHVHTYC